jgi:hypothetical protein
VFVISIIPELQLMPEEGFSRLTALLFTVI